MELNCNAHEPGLPHLPAGIKTPPAPLAFQTARFIPIESQVSLFPKGKGRGGLNVPESQYGE